MLNSTTRKTIPEDGRIEILTTPDGLHLRTAFWRAVIDKPRGLVLICQGRAETIEKYGETIMDLRQRGFAVAAFDWRGQGGSDRLLANPLKGHIGDFADYRTDLDCVMGHFTHQTGLPLILLGHSMGGMVLLESLTATHPALCGTVLCSPMFEITLLARRPWLRWVIGACYGLGLAHSDPPGRKRHSVLEMDYTHNPLTSDPVRFERLKSIMRANTQLAIAAPTIGWLFHAVRAMAKRERIAEQLRASGNPRPLLIVAPDDDSVTDSRATRALAPQLPACELVTLQDCRHEILMERDTIRTRFWEAFDRWADRLLPKDAAASTD